MVVYVIVEQLGYNFNIDLILEKFEVYNVIIFINLFKYTQSKAIETILESLKHLRFGYYTTIR